VRFTSFSRSTTNPLGLNGFQVFDQVYVMTQGGPLFRSETLVTYIYEETLGWDIVRDGVAALTRFHQRALRTTLEHGAAISRIDARLLDYDLDALAAALDPTAREG